MPALENAAELLTSAFSTGDCLGLVLSKPRRPVIHEFTRVDFRPVQLAGAAGYQLTFHFPRRETHENLPPDEACRRAVELLTTGFAHAHLFTAAADFALRARKEGGFHVQQSPPTRQAVGTTHNRTKQYLIPDGVPCPFLIEIGVMGAAGNVLAAKYHKFRQINRFLEFVEDVIPHLPRDRPLQVFDFGSGKSYLTFALHHLLTAIHGFAVRIIGVDRNAEVVRDCTRVAERLRLTGIAFHVGDIRSVAIDGPVDLTVALHACDTATDDALAQAVERDCPVILAVPCCQHELANKIQVADLRPLSAHGILHERFSALATDALRAQLLEICGYQTQLLEFIDLEHTAKNLLLRAVRHPRPAERHMELISEYERFKSALGLTQPYLETLLATRFGVPEL